MGLIALDKTANAQNKSQLTVSASQVDEKKLPFPGQILTLTAEVSNTRDFRLPARVLIVRDGQFQEIKTQPGVLGANEKPQYKVEVPSPVGELVYQFVVTGPDGTISSSLRQTVRRSCIPNLSPALSAVPDQLDGEERFSVLMAENKRLEQEIANLETAALELDSMKELISQ